MGRNIDEILDELLIDRGEHPTRVRNPLYGEERNLAKNLLNRYLREWGMCDHDPIEKRMWYECSKCGQIL